MVGFICVDLCVDLLSDPNLIYKNGEAQIASISHDLAFEQRCSWGATTEILFTDLTIGADPNNSSNTQISLTATNDILAIVEGVDSSLITALDFG